jgi:hypothetical protein
MLWQPRLLDMGLQQGLILREWLVKDPDVLKLSVNVRNYEIDERCISMRIETDLPDEILPIFKTK